MSESLDELGRRVAACIDTADKHEAAARSRRIEAGRALIEAKERLQHGDWLPWLAKHGIQERQAQRCMALARDPEGKPKQRRKGAGAEQADKEQPKSDSESDLLNQVYERACDDAAFAETAIWNAMAGWGMGQEATEQAYAIACECYLESDDREERQWLILNNVLAALGLSDAGIAKARDAIDDVRKVDQEVQARNQRLLPAPATA